MAKTQTAPDCYDYVRSYYRVPAYIGVRVRASGREGALVNHRPADQYVYVLFDGDRRATGPLHPTDVEYLVAGALSKNGVSSHE